VLVVEDEMLIAMLIADMLTDFGHQVVGPASRLQRALKIAREEKFDLAILDINLANEKSFPVADVLRERGVPFIFATGYGSQGLNDDFAGATTLRKPFEPHQLKAAISSVLHPTT
jgi:DNA-binding response OmpR family regulator